MPIDQLEKHDLQINNMPSPDFSQIREKPQNPGLAKIILLLLKILGALIIILVIAGAILGFIYYKNFKEASDLAFSAKTNLELSLHKVVNREFVEAAELIKQANSEFIESKELLNKVVIVRHIPYIGTQLKAVDNLLEAGIKLTDSGQKVVLLIDDIVKPLQNESITYATITPEQKKAILNKIVESEDLLYEVQGQIDEAVIAIDAIPEKKLVAPLREGIAPLKENLPKAKVLIDHTIPMLKVVPKIVGFDQPRTYLFLLQNNHELRPTGGFIGTYGILKLQDGELKQFDTDNIYNLDRAPQYQLKEPSPEPIAVYLEQPYWSLRDINWSPDFPTTAEKSLYMYDEEYRIWQELKESGKTIVGEEDITVAEIIPYEPNIDGVIAMTPEVLEGMLKITGPIVVNGRMFNDENFQDELEYVVGREFRQLDIPISERKEIIKKLADQITLKLMSMPFHRITDVLAVVFDALDQKQILIYVKDPGLQQLVMERNWAGAVKNTENDYLMVVDTNMASLKTDQYVERSINYTFKWQGDDLIANVKLTYNNNADFTWKSTRLRSYTRIYVPLDSQLISSSGAMIDDKNKIEKMIREKNFPEGVNEEEYIEYLKANKGEVDVSTELNKTVFGAFISIEPHETGVLTFEYKLPDRIKDQIRQGNYNLLIQKQPGVMHNLTLALNFDKTIKSATPAESEIEWFNTSYDYSTVLDKDKQFFVSFK